MSFEVVPDPQAVVVTTPVALDAATIAALGGTPATGGATEAKQDEQLTALALLARENTLNAIGMVLSAFASANHVDLGAILTQLGQTLAVSAASLPLPAGARIEAGHGSTYANPDYSRDYFDAQEILETQTADATGLLTFTFSAPVALAYVFLVDQQSHTGHYTANGLPPSSTFGVPILPGVPNSIPSKTTTVEVLCSNGGQVTVWGYRY